MDLLSALPDRDQDGRVVVQRRVARGAAAGLIAVYVASALAVVLLVGPGVLLGLGRAVVGFNPAHDFQIMTWSLEWWPWALAHGVNPLRTGLLWAPVGFSTLWMTTIPVVAALAAPLTLTVGPLVAYNVLMIAAVPLASGAAYLLCRELTGRSLPAVVGGLLFGLSPYMLGHTLSQHLDLVFVFPLPLVAFVAVRYVRGKTKWYRAVPALALLLLVQLGASFELFLDLSLFVALALVLAMLGAARWRRAVVRLAGVVVLAYAVLLPVLAPIAVLGLTGSHAALRFAPTSYAIDLANLVVPTPTQVLGALHAARAISVHFVGNVGEQDGYLGIPLLFIALLALVKEWRRGAWLVGGLFLIAVTLSFGPLLTLGGRPLLANPFTLARLPLLRDALPARLSVFSALAASVLAALWIAQQRRRWLKWVVVVALAVSVLPNFWPPAELPGAWAISDEFGYVTAHVPHGFVADPVWTRLMRPGATVLVLPTGDRTAASWWQVESGMRFALAVPATPFAPPAVAGQPVVQGLVNNNLPQLDGTRLSAARLRAFLVADHIAGVVVTPAAGLAWQRTAALATATRPLLLDGALFYRVSPGLRPLVANGRLLVKRQRQSSLVAWLHFSGRHAEVRAVYRAVGRHGERAVPLAIRAGDASDLAAALDSRGTAAVAFSEYRRGLVTLEVATCAGRSWRITALQHGPCAVGAVRVAVLRNDRVVVAWVDEVDPLRSLQVAELSPRGRWPAAQTLDTAASVEGVNLAAYGAHALVIWGDTVASEQRVCMAMLAGQRWSGPMALATSLWDLGRVSLVRGATPVVRWWLAVPGAKRRLEFAHRLMLPRSWVGAGSPLRGVAQTVVRPARPLSS